MDCLSQFEKLKRSGEFQRIYHKAKGAHSHSFVLFYSPVAGEKKIGFTASKKVGNAVERNRCKRRMRALFTEFCEAMNDGHYVFVAKTSMNDTTYDVLKRECKKVLIRTGGIADDKKTPS